MSLDTTIPALPSNASQEAGGNLEALARLARNPDVQLDDDGIPYVNPNVPGADIATGDRQNIQIALAQNTQPPVVPADTFTAITSVGVAAQIALNGASRVVVAYQGTYSGITVFFEASQDNQTWFTLRGVNSVSGAVINGSTPPPNNSQSSYIFDVNGWFFFRVRASAYISGQMNVAISPAYPPSPVAVTALAVGLNADGTAIGGNPVRIGGTDGVNIRTILTDATGVVQVNAPATQNVNVTNNPLPVTGSLTISPSPTPTLTQDDDAQYDDDGYRYVNPNVPGADIATGDRQNAQIALATSAQAPLALPATLAPITGAGDVVPVTLNGASRVVLSFSGTYSGISLVFEASQEGTNWFSIRGINLLNASPANGNTNVSNNSNGAYAFDVAGWNFWRVRCSAFTSGQMNVAVSPVLYAQPLGVNAAVGGVSGAGAASTGFPVMVAGSDGANIRTLLTDTTGALSTNSKITDGVNGTVAVQPGTPAPLSAPALTVTQSPAEPGGGPDQRTADLLEAILTELRVLTTICANLGQARAEDTDALRNDLQSTIN